ncbi:MAG TPA: DUF6577 family protein [Chitinophagaceae bacterium]|nr:DUF6577 family protein [Chitinophagaceae bacterium]
MRTFIETKLFEEFFQKSSISREELFRFYKTFDPELKEGTFGWRIYELKRKNIIKSVKKGIYTIVNKKEFKPDFNQIILDIGKHLQSSFDHHNYNIWNTAWLNEFIELQIISYMIILETDRSSMESVFYNLKDNGFQNIFLKPDEGIIDIYISEISSAIIVKPMISRSPVKVIRKIQIPTLEKILVDLFCDEKIFYAFQGNQLVKIYEASFEKYTINLSRLLNYAKRRKREEAIKDFLLENINEKIKDFIE